MKSLATKCGYVFISREHVHAITREVIVYKDSEGDKDLVEPSLQLLVEIAIYCPELMADAEEDLLALLKDSDDSIKEGVVHIMSKSGAAFRNKGTASEGRSNVNLILEQLCVEGNRKQAKYAVSAIAAMTADSGLKALSVLYGRLVDKLEDNTHLPTVLQSLGCIAQNAMPIFETREDDIIKFVVRNVLRRPNPQEVPEFVSDGDSPSDHVLLKIYALKALVKSFLPKMNVHQRTRLPGLLKVLVKILACGEITDDLKTSPVDKAHLRLAAAKGVLRLARRWDSQIPIDVFHMVVMTVQDHAAHVRRALLKKIHHYLRDRTLNLKYASAYALCTVDTVQDIALEARQFMSDFVDDYRKEAHRTMTGQAERTTITLLPEYALVYLVHVLAHHPNYPVASGGVQPEPSAYEPFYRELLFFLRALILQDGDAKGDAGKKEDGDNLPLILAILRTIKGCENVVDKTKTETLYAVCDIAILITKDIAQQKKKLVETYPGVIPLPASVYKVCEPKAPEVKATVAQGAEPTGVESKVGALKASEVKPAEASAPEAKAAEANASKAAESNDSKVAEVSGSKAGDAEAKTGEGDAQTAEAEDTKMAEANDTKAGVVEDTKTGEVEDIKMAEAEDTETVGSEDANMAEAADAKTGEAADAKTGEAAEAKTGEAADAKTGEAADAKSGEAAGGTTAEAGESKPANPIETDPSEANGSKASDLNESEVPAPGDTIAAAANGTDAVEAEKPGAADTAEVKESEAVESTGPVATEPASKSGESGQPTPPVAADVKSAGAEAKKSVGEPAKVDGSHLPPCFTDKDVLARFKNVLAKSGQPASPRGRKRAKRVDNGDTVSDNTEVELEHSEPTPKKGKVDNEKRGKGGAGSGTGVIIKGPSRGGRKSVDKNESAKKAGKKVELEKEGEEELDENTPSKRKRGRPKGSGKKEEALSGDEMAGPSSESTPTTSAKKGKPAGSEARPLTESGKKRGRPAKAKEEDVQEKSAQKKDKVATPDKSAKKASAVEKGTSPAWRSEGERGGDESLVGCGIKVWWPLDKKFYKGEVVEYDAKKKKHKILYNDGEQEILNLAKERWELTGKPKTPSAKKEKTPTATPAATLSGTKYPEPKKLKVTAKTPTESAKTPDTSKEVASEKTSAKAASAGKAGKDAEKTPKASKSAAVDKEQAASAFDFDEEGEEEPAAKKQKTAAAPKASGGKHSKAEKAMSTSKDSAAESAKETSEGKAKEGKDVENAEDDEPLVGQLEDKEREEVKASE
ncbi:hypothetical protein KC19_12G013000 [Ceratodon purpureus]|uniref:Uncharacterized protein n=1 Tax=Ceratodon purpureus TaxID=3225 RepID=A0A8T0G5U5_CERPU|nr:hypothetical protein KC19_12G013000 [Ceratodon purpureus]